ncbi:hypothetical protein [Pleurocapsa sp. PCC 7319]|uniref:hypothetical protein n=1 Tax=Pleurocapsa sp. PCC 7319 TaxID=118161 RepID=UPI000346D961|nr:hypothetical protein [Pleurocapsa sp. PCC 7319]
MSKLKSDFQSKVAKLYRLTVYGRWLFILFNWLTFGVYALWNLREEIALWFDYFTWAAVYYGFHFNFVPTLCLAFCVGTTVSVLVWQSRNLLWGLPAQEQRQLEKQVKKILKQGATHPLWKWIQ